MRKTDTHVYFWGDEYSQWFSNDNQFQDGQGNFFNNAEKYMMMEKAKLFNDTEIYEKMKATDDPRKIKALGRKVKGFNEKKWNENRIKIVTEGSLMKFSQNPKLLELMKQDKGLILVEASPLDKIWGVGLHFNDDDVLDESKWKGENLLGICLMNAREIMLKDGLFNV